MANLTYKGTTFTVEYGENITATALSISYLGRGWYKATLKGGGSLTFPLEEDEWVAISKPDMKKYQAAKKATEELREARFKYIETMKSLSATTKSSGSYEDYESWLEIPGVPGIDWEDV